MKLSKAATTAVTIAGLDALCSMLSSCRICLYGSTPALLVEFCFEGFSATVLSATGPERAANPIPPAVVIHDGKPTRWEAVSRTGVVVMTGEVGEELKLVRGGFRPSDDLMRGDEVGIEEFVVRTA